MMSAKKSIVVLAGDGIGREVVPEAVRLLEEVRDRRAAPFEIRSAKIGVAALEESGSPMSDETLELCRSADAVLLGALGDPRYEDLSPLQRPEVALLNLRRELDVYANLRPARFHPALADRSPLREEVARDADIVFVRELSGGIYYGEPRGERRRPDGTVEVVNTMSYDEGRIRRVAERAFALARTRRGKLVSVDKANVLEVSRFWRKIVDDVGSRYPDVEWHHRLVDSFALSLVTQPRDFDVVLTPNLFGDILSDEAAALGGSLGLLASASLGPGTATGLYEPVHGSAPDIAGRGIANPIGVLLTTALMFRFAFEMPVEAAALEAAVDDALGSGARTADIAGPNDHAIGTEEMGERVRSAFWRRLDGSTDAGARMTPSTGRNGGDDERVA